SGGRIDQHVHDDPALASGGRIDDDASLELCHAHQHPSLHMVVCGPLWASRRLAGKPRLNTKLLLGWSDLAEGGVDESVIGDLHTAGHEKWHAERRDAERKAAQHGRKR